jgi:hypothetical protein
MNTDTVETRTNQAHARSLLADIQHAPQIALPRRETLVDWLNAYLVRAERRGYVDVRAETDDLVALDKFLRSAQIPVAADPSP